jgi:elongation factor P
LPHRRKDSAARLEIGPAARKGVGPPPSAVRHAITPFISAVELLGTCAKSPDCRNCRAKGSAMKINAIDIRPGFVLENGGKLMLVLKRDIVQPGKGGAFTQIEMRDIKTGTKTIERYRTQETVERATLEEKEMQFLYMDGNQATFMDSETYEQIAVDRELIGEAADFLQENMVCTVQLHEGTPLSVSLPQTVTLEVVEADPVVKGQTASSSYKPGKLENGRRVMIPPHIGAGTRIVVNTADGSYVERAKD